MPSPNSPTILNPPQHIVTRSTVIPHAEPDPLDKCANVTPVAPGTGMFGELALLPSPNVPRVLLPQQYVCSSSVRPQVCQKPALMDLKRKSPDTRTGVVLHGLGFTPSDRQLSVLAAPSCPYWFHPQQYASPSAVRPQLCRHPASMVLNRMPPDTGNGRALHAATCPKPNGQTSVLAAPSSRDAFCPQQYASPRSVSPHACDPDIVIEANSTSVTTRLGVLAFT